MSLTPAHEALKAAALAANKLGLSGTKIEAEFRDLAHPAAILELFAQLEAQAAPRTYEQCTEPDCDCGLGVYRCKPNVVREVRSVPEPKRLSMSHFATMDDYRAAQAAAVQPVQAAPDALEGIDKINSVLRGEVDRLIAARVPDILFDGMAVYEEVRRQAGYMRTSPENVSDVLDAAVRLIRRAEPPQ